MRVGSHPRPVLEGARTAQGHQRIGSRPPRAHEAFQLGDRQHAVVARFDLSVRVEFENARRSLAPAVSGLLDGSKPRCRGNGVEQIAGRRVGRFRQHWQGRPRRRRWRGFAGELVSVDYLALAVARVRPVDCELPRPERTEALKEMLRYGGVVWIAATIPAPRSEPSKWLVDACDPGFLGSAGV